MVYRRRVDKKNIPTVKILGVNIAAINMNWLISFTTEHIKELSGDYICVSNVHTTVMSYEDKKYRMIQNNGILAIPDGGPLCSVGRKRGAPNMGRTTGPSYMGEILRVSLKYGWKHFFYGSTRDTLNKMVIALKKDYPGLQIVGMYSPPFRQMTKKEDKRIIDMINSCSPDFVWVGLGAPKQEIWMSQHQGKVKGLMVGVGAAFDYYAGNIKRAPIWMQKNNLEWFYRLLQDPKRLFKRYVLTNSKFILEAIIKHK